MKLENLAIIILNYKNYIFTINAIENILNISKEITVIVVDNDSKNNSYSILKNKYKSISQVKVIESKKNLGYANGNNIGIRAVINNEKIENIAIMNPDVIIPNLQTLENCIKILNFEKNSAIVAPTMITNGRINFNNIAWKIPKNFDDLFLILRDKYKKKIGYLELKIYNYKNQIFYSNVEVLPGAFFIIKKDILKEINFLDENTFLYCEERILSQRIKNIGKQNFLILNNNYFHNHLNNYENNNFYFDTYINSLKYFNNKYNGKKGIIVSKIIGFYKLLYRIKRWIKNNEE